MIIEALLNLISSIFQFVFNLLPDLPQFPSRITAAISSFLDLIFSNVGILGVFVSIDLVKILVPLILVVINFDHIYHLVLWILKKIPFLNMK